MAVNTINAKLNSPISKACSGSNAESTICLLPLVFELPGTTGRSQVSGCKGFPCFSCQGPGLCARVFEWKSREKLVGKRQRRLVASISWSTWNSVSQVCCALSSSSWSFGQDIMTIMSGPNTPESSIEDLQCCVNFCCTAK